MDYFQFNNPTNWINFLQAFYQYMASDPLVWAFGWQA